MIEPDLFEQSKLERREFLKSHGYKPSVAMTVLTRIPHWESADGRIFTEAEAALREEKRERTRPPTA